MDLLGMHDHHRRRTLSAKLYSVKIGSTLPGDEESLFPFCISLRDEKRQSRCQTPKCELLAVC
jgi:hypothetical protein